MECNLLIVIKQVVLIVSDLLGMWYVVNILFQIF